MEKLKQFWEFFNGRKTTIGAIILFAAVFLKEVGVGIWGIDTDWFPKVIETLNWIGLSITGIGLTHKTIKQDTKPTE